MSKKKNDEGASEPGARLTLHAHVELFYAQYTALNRDVEKLAVIYAEAKAEYPEFDAALTSRGVFVTGEFLDALQKIADKKLHPAVLLQSRGFIRLGRMTYEDQAKLVNSGLQVAEQSGQHTAKLCEMSDELIMQVVTSHGRVRSVDEQKEYLKQLKEASGRRVESKRDRIARRVRQAAPGKGPDYVRTDNGVRFTNPDRVWTPAELRQLLLAIWNEHR